MMRTSSFTLPLYACFETSLVGGKAANLGRLVRAGFPVPEGFVLTTRAYRLAQRSSPAAHVPAEVAEEIRLAYQAMGQGPVAVRSSATVEDAAAASMAGQYETILGIEGETALLEAVRRCWASLDTPRTQAYLKEHGIDGADVAMAVVVQRLVSADVAGVLFTTNPHQGRGGEMLLEASWGLGEALVSGQVQPDTLRLDRETGRVLEAVIADKYVHCAAGSGQEEPVEEASRHRPCLRSGDVYCLWQLGKQAVTHFGVPQDMEWAISANEIYVLQTRPITTLQDTEAYEEVLHATRQELRHHVSMGRGPWVLHNLAETLPHPTPLTWSVVGRFMSGSGGLGAMYRQAGFAPSPLVCREGFLDLIAGRVYMDTSRTPEMFFEKFPFAYDIEELKRCPNASQMPPTLPRGSLLRRLKARRRLAAVQTKLRALAVDYDRQLRDTFFPAIVRHVTDAKQSDLRSFSVEQLIDFWQEHEKQVLDAFGPQSLLPSLIGEMALGELRSFLAEHFWDEDPDALAQGISSGGPPTRTVVSDAELHEVGQGKRPLETWLAEHGHRASGEFDLAAPRWREQPEAVRQMAARLADGDNPLERHRRQADAVNQRIQALRQRLSASASREFDRRIDLERRYVAFREDGKDYLMLGYDLLRDVALEAARRLDLGPDIFYLTRRIFSMPCGWVMLLIISFSSEKGLIEPKRSSPCRA